MGRQMKGEAVSVDIPSAVRPGLTLVLSRARHPQHNLLAARWNFILPADFLSMSRERRLKMLTSRRSLSTPSLRNSTQTHTPPTSERCRFDVVIHASGTTFFFVKVGLPDTYSKSVCLFTLARSTVIHRLGCLRLHHHSVRP